MIIFPIRALLHVNFLICPHWWPVLMLVRLFLLLLPLTLFCCVFGDVTRIIRVQGDKTGICLLQIFTEWALRPRPTPVTSRLPAFPLQADSCQLCQYCPLWIGFFSSYHWCLLYNLQVIQRVMGQLVMSLALTSPNTPVSEQADLLRGYMYNFDC